MTLNVTGKGISKFSFHGNVHCLDEFWEEIVKNQIDTLMIGTKAAARIADDQDSMASIEINIQNKKTKLMKSPMKSPMKRPNTSAK